MADSSNELLQQTIALHEFCRCLFRRIKVLALQHAAAVDDLSHKSSLEKAIAHVEETAPSMTAVVPWESNHRSNYVTPGINEDQEHDADVDCDTDNEGDANDGANHVGDDDDANNYNHNDPGRKATALSSPSAVASNALPQLPDIKAYLARLPILDFVARNINGLKSTAEKEKRLCTRANVLLSQAHEQQGMMAEERETREMTLRRQLKATKAYLAASLQFTREDGDDRKGGQDPTTTRTTIALPDHSDINDNCPLTTDVAEGACVNYVAVGMNVRETSNESDPDGDDQASGNRDGSTDQTKECDSRESEKSQKLATALNCDQSTKDEERHQEELASLRQQSQSLQAKHDIMLNQVEAYQQNNAALELQLAQLKQVEDDYAEAMLEMDKRVVSLAGEVKKLGKAKTDLRDCALGALSALDSNNLSRASTTLQQLLCEYGEG
jgi:hypothetical protein